MVPFLQWDRHPWSKFPTESQSCSHLLLGICIRRRKKPSWKQLHLLCLCNVAYYKVGMTLYACKVLGMLIVIDTTLSLMCCIHVCAVSCCCFVCCCLLFVSLSVCLFWPVRKVSRVSSIIPSSWNKVFSSSKMSPRKVGILRCFSPLSPFSPTLSLVGLGPTWHRYFCQFHKEENGTRGKTRQMKFTPVGHHGSVRRSIWIWK